MIISLLFYVFSAILVLSSNMVVNVKNSVFSVLYLVLSFISASILLFVFECEFLALIFIIVYVGAIAVLFLFVVMMLDVKTSNEKDTVKYFPIVTFLGIIFFFEVLSDISKCFLNDSDLYNASFYFNWYDKLDVLTDTETLGQIIYTHHTLQFLVSGFVLFLAVIGSVLITINFSIKNI